MVLPQYKLIGSTEHRDAAPNVHLIYTSLITSQPLNPNSKNESWNLKRLNQFLSSVHSLKKLPIQSQSFYIELSSEYAEYRQIVLEQIRLCFPNSRIFWKRLANFEEWANASKEIDLDANLVLLKSNCDHAYISQTSEPFFNLCIKVLEHGTRALAEITHWPEALSEIASPWGKLQHWEFGNGYLSRQTNIAVGTTLMTKELFREWWSTDFTNGSKIVRPDNPFGPSVRFDTATLIIPLTELFRHMDGYEHVGIKSPFAQQFLPCCEILNLKVIHQDWSRLTFPNILNSHKNFKVLPDELEIFKGLPANYLMVASAHRIDLRILVFLVKHKLTLDYGVNIKLQIVTLLLRSKDHRKLIARMLVENTLLVTLLRLIRVKENPRKFKILSEIMSLGVSRGTFTWLIRTIRRQVKKALSIYTQIRKYLDKRFG